MVSFKPFYVTLSNQVFLPLGGDDDDGPEAKRAKSDSPASVLTGTPPASALTPGLGPSMPVGGIPNATMSLPGVGVAPGAMGIPGIPGAMTRAPFGVAG